MSVTQLINVSRTPRGRRSTRRGFLAINLAVVGLLTATISPAHAALSSGAGTQTNFHALDGGNTGGNGGTREGCVKYNSSRFALTFTSGTIDDGAGGNPPLTAGPAGPITVIVDTLMPRYEGPGGTYHPTYQSGGVKEVSTVSGDSGCYTQWAGDHPVTGSVALTVTRGEDYPLTNPYCQSTNPNGSMKRGDGDGLPSGTQISDPDDRFYTITGVTCASATYTLLAELDLETVTTQVVPVCVAPIAPATCLIGGATTLS